MQLAVGGDTLFLPLLPVPNAEMDAKKEAGNLQIWIQKIDPQALETPDRQRLEILERAVNDLVLNGVSIPSDQVCTQIADPFQQILKYNNPELTQRFLEQLPVYFTEMEQRWQAPAAQKIPDAMLEATAAFDALQLLQRQSPPAWNDKFTTARLALKDYISLCQSSLL